MPIRIGWCLQVCLLLIGGWWPNWVMAAEPGNFLVSGRIQSDIRFRPIPIVAGDAWYNQVVAPSGVSRNQSLVNLRLKYDMHTVAMAGDMDFLWLGFNQKIQNFSDLYERNHTDPYRLKLHGAYVEARDFLLPGLDLRLGQQLVNWGKGDQFNPTNNINANDFEDPLLFGQQLANSMLRLDYTSDFLAVCMVLVPVFKPALLPASAFMALSNVQRVMVYESNLQLALLGEQLLSDTIGYPALTGILQPELPAPLLQNMQGGLRLAAAIFNQDVAVSYYVGRSDIPQPTQIKTQQQAGGCSSSGSDCVDGFLRADIALQYPRMQVFGLNLAGEIPMPPPFEDHLPLGYHLELAIIFPEQLNLRIFKGAILGEQPGEYDYQLDGQFPTVVRKVPFAKWNLGFDYTLFHRIYINAQWIHGFVDEFGAGDYFYRSYVAVEASNTDTDCDDYERCVNTLVRNRLGDYLVLGSDLRFLSDKLLARLFLVYDLSGLWQTSFDTQQNGRRMQFISPFSSQAATAVVFPELTYNAGGGLELSVGALTKLGHRHTKFGDPAAGGTDIWTRARYSY